MLQGYAIQLYPGFSEDDAEFAKALSHLKHVPQQAVRQIIMEEHTIVPGELTTTKNYFGAESEFLSVDYGERESSS